MKNVLERDGNVTWNGMTDREYTDLKERILSLEVQIKIKDEQLHTINKSLKLVFKLFLFILKCYLNYFV